MPSLAHQTVILPFHNTGYRWKDEPEHTLLYHVRIAINNSGMSSSRLSDHVFQQTGQTLHKRTILSLLDGKPNVPNFAPSI